MTIAVHPDLQTEDSATGRLLRSVTALAVSRRRALQLALAALWLLDAALQYQPYMFTKSFVTSGLAPAAQGDPTVIAAPMRWTLQLLSDHPAPFNAAFATVQLAIAVGLLWRRTARAALVGSIAWALGVWWFGEGLGGVLTGASPLMGAPGPVLLYALVALLVWPRSGDAGHDSVAAGGAIGLRGARLAWAGLWGVLAYLFVLPANRAPGALGDAVAGMTGGQPAWLARFDGHLAGGLAGSSPIVPVILAGICYLIGVSVFVPRLARAGVAAAAVAGTVLWIAQGFGGILTGRGTDPSSGLPLVLLAAAFWPMARAARRAAAPSGLAERRRPDRHLDRRPDSSPDRRLGAWTAAVLAVAGAAAGVGVGPAAAAAAGPGMPGMALRPAPQATVASRVTAGPSESARMVCSAEVHRDLTTALALSSTPPSSSTWADHLYTCTYRLASGPLVIAVKELDGVPAARTYFAGLLRRLTDPRPVLGLASLGLPGDQTPAGTVVFLKDDKTLTVDASALTGPVGPNRVSPTDFAYQIATDILGCWTGG